MSAVRTSLVTRNHAWTGEDVPWDIDTDGVSDAMASESEKVRRRLFHYLSGGGLSACGSSSARALAYRRQCRFLVFAGALAVLWTVFWII